MCAKRSLAVVMSVCTTFVSKLLDELLKLLTLLWGWTSITKRLKRCRTILLVTYCDCRHYGKNHYCKNLELMTLMTPFSIWIGVNVLAKAKFTVGDTCGYNNPKYVSEWIAGTVPPSTETAMAISDVGGTITIEIVRLQLQPGRNKRKGLWKGHLGVVKL